MLGVLLISLTVCAAWYALVSAASNKLPDARPLIMAFFLLSALSILEVTWVLSPEYLVISDYFITVWFSVEMLLVVCILWLIFVINNSKESS